MGDGRDGGGGGRIGGGGGVGREEKKKNIEKTYPMPWTDDTSFHETMTECGVVFDSQNDLNAWKWFHGDVGKFYNILVDSDSKNDVNNIASYAVHRWMGKDRSTLIHYDLIYKAVEAYLPYFGDVEGLRRKGKVAKRRR